MQMAAASDQFEIRSSQTLLQTSRNASLRQFAQMMIDHHTQTSAELMSAARASNLTPSAPALDTRKAEMVRALELAAGMSRDRLYVEQQVIAHQEALALHSNYAASGDNAALRAVAAKAVPIVQGHLTAAQRLQSGIS
jgi:putative membrane protein